MDGAVGEVEEERLVGVVGPQRLEVGDRLVGDVVGEVVAVGVLVDVDGGVVADQPVGVMEVRPALEDPVEPVEPALERPRVARGAVVHDRVAGEVPLADREGGVAGASQHLGERVDVGADLHRPPREAGIEVGDAGESGAVGVEPGQQGGSRRRAQRARVVVREAQPVGCEAVERRRRDLRSVRADVAEARGRRAARPPRSAPGSGSASGRATTASTPRRCDRPVPRTPPRSAVTSAGSTSRRDRTVAPEARSW